MNPISQQLDAWQVGIIFACAMTLCWGVGHWWGQRHKVQTQELENKFVDVNLAILGLLLAFTFSMAQERHDQRRQAVLDQSTAISDFYTCASLLKEPCKGKLQGVIREYTELKLAAQRKKMSQEEELQESKTSQTKITRMTEIVAEAIAGGTPIAGTLTSTLNSVSTKEACMRDAYRERLPSSILALLIISSLIPLFLMGYKQGASNEKTCLRGMLCFVILVTLIIYVTLDLNQPKRGMLKVNLQELELTIDSMGK